MFRSPRRAIHAVTLALIAIGATIARPARASEIWVVPTYQQDLGGVGTSSNVFWPVTAVGVVRLAWAVPADLQTFDSAKVAVIPSTPGGASTLNFFVCPAQNNGAVSVGCVGPFQQGFVGVPNQLSEVEIGGLLAAHVGTPGSTYLAVLAYTTPTTATDHIVGLRFGYTPTAPAGTATLASNTFTGTQTAPAFAGDGAGLTNINAATATTAQNALQLGGQAASQYVVTSDARLSDARVPLPGSTTYVQNTTSTQAATNFNISGNGTLGGAIAANAVASNTQYSIGANRVLSVSGTQNTNTFVGVQAGNANPTGGFNSLFGNGAGLLLGTGANNSFFGYHAGSSNQTGGSNTFIGAAAGQEFGTDGTGNTVVGAAFGPNVSGNFNTLIGAGVDRNLIMLGDSTTAIGYDTVASGTNAMAIGAHAFSRFDNSTAIGANSQTTQANSLVLGSIAGVNQATVDTNVGIGTTAPASRLHVNGSVRVTNGSVYVSNPNTLIITSPNGACWGITVSNAGTVSAFSTPCP